MSKQLIIAILILAVVLAIFLAYTQFGMLMPQ